MCPISLSRWRSKGAKRALRPRIATDRLHNVMDTGNCELVGLYVTDFRSPERTIDRQSHRMQRTGRAAVHSGRSEVRLASSVQFPQVELACLKSFQKHSPLLLDGPSPVHIVKSGPWRLDGCVQRGGIGTSWVATKRKDGGGMLEFGV